MYRVCYYILPARAGKVKGHVSRVGRHFISAILYYSVSGRLQHFVRRGRHESVSARTLVLHADEYLHHKFLAALRFATANVVHVLEILASPRTIASVSPVVAHRRPQRAPFLLMLQSVVFFFKEFFAKSAEDDLFDYKIFSSPNLTVTSHGSKNAEVGNIPV